MTMRLKLGGDERHKEGHTQELQERMKCGLGSGLGWEFQLYAVGNHQLLGLPF
jgi:hypothetical protein